MLKRKHRFATNRFLSFHQLQLQLVLDCVALIQFDFITSTTVMNGSTIPSAIQRYAFCSRSLAVHIVSIFQQHKPNHCKTLLISLLSFFCTVLMSKMDKEPDHRWKAAHPAPDSFYRIFRNVANRFFTDPIRTLKCPRNRCLATPA